MHSKFDELEKIIAAMIQCAGSGHFASSASALQIMVPLFYEQGVTPDRFILSKGHAAPALYAILFDLGYLKQGDLAQFRKYELPGHPELKVPGVLCSSGSLGMGISKAVGLATANPDKVYHVLVGDGELQEGQNWEAIFYLLANGIENVRIHVDCNGRQYSGELRRDNLAWIPPNCIQYHYTTWRHDNSYLTRKKETYPVYARALENAMIDDPRIVCLNADLEQDFGLTIIKEHFPGRYIQCGISEQHMVSMANGLALAGKIPVCHGFAAFYRRAVDQIYNNECDGLSIGYVATLTKPTSVNIGKSHAPTPGLFNFLGVVTADNPKEFFEMLLDPEEPTGVYLEV